MGVWGSEGEEKKGRGEVVIAAALLAAWLFVLPAVHVAHGKAEKRTKRSPLETVGKHVTLFP